MTSCMSYDSLLKMGSPVVFILISDGLGCISARQLKCCEVCSLVLGLLMDLGFVTFLSSTESAPSSHVFGARLILTFRKMSCFRQCIMRFY